MRDPIFGKRTKRRGLKLLEIDSWIDSQLYDMFSSSRERYDAFSAWMTRFHVSGWKRFFVEIMSDGLSYSVVGGMILLSLAMPAFDITDNAWQQTTQYSVTFTDRFGRPIGKRGILHNDAVPLDQIPDHMIKAALATEDRRFFEHFGIDFLGLVRAMGENVRANDVVQGGSTLTQQLAKNLFLSPERSLDRKIKEAFLSLWLEARLTKREILKLYLDRAYMGAGTVGVDAAAQYYFGKSIRDVSLAEAAMLAGLFKAPTRFAPHANLPAARARANEVLDNMVEAGFLTEGEVYGARQHPATVIDKSDDYVPNYFLDWAFGEVQRLVNGKDFVLTVRTTIDTNLQKGAESIMEATLRQEGRQYGASQAAMVVLEHDGAVRTMIGGRDYGESQFNRATDALRQPGSSFKPFVYLAALERGYTPDSVIVDAPITLGNWSPKNYGRSYAGRVTLMTALTKSINTVPVRLSLAIGRDAIAETAHKAGIRSNLLITKSLPLGTSEVTVLDMASAYASFANGGKRAEPYGILEIRNSQGELIYQHDRDAKPPERIADPVHIAELNSMLSNVVEHGTARRAQLDFTIAAGKTGTTQAYRDAWFIGFTGKYSAAVWFGNDNFQPTRRMTGGSIPAQTWKKVMSIAHTEQDILPIPGALDPRGVMSGVRPVPVASSDDPDELPAEPATVVRSSTLSKPMLETLDRLDELFTTLSPVSSRTSGGKSAALSSPERPAIPLPGTIQ